MTLILYNPHANNNDVTAALDGAMAYAAAPDTQAKDMTTVDVRAEICALGEKDRVLICGGDGTLMRLANALEGAEYSVPLYLWKSGTGNDFLRDLGKNEDNEPVLLNPYLKKLPSVKIAGKTYRYVNGIGFGLDGMVCEVTDKLKERGVKKINYTMESIKLLLGGFGEKVAAWCAAHEKKNRLLMLGVEGICTSQGARDQQLQRQKLDAQSVAKRIFSWKENE